MLVLVTGGTGFLGAHTVAALVREGHQVRLLARAHAGVERALGPLGVSARAVEVSLGDVTDRAAVNRAVRGVDAVVHAAAVFSFDTRQNAAMRRTNVAGTELVLSAARQFDVGRTVYVSTFGAMLPASGGVIGTRTAPGAAREPYLASKAAAETVAREHQAQGAPVVITYPPALLGPDDPKLGDQNARLRNMLRGLMPMWPSGGFPVGDVRDTAALHTALLTAPADGPDRHFGPGRYASTREFVRSARLVTGRSLPAVFLPARAMMPMAYLAGLAQRIWPWHIPAEYGACYVCACDARPDDEQPPLGIAPRPFTQTLADTVRWLHRRGLVTARQAGRAVGSADVSAAAPEHV
ncbi:SDR family NAD(P)-dependent oxidoreductase [Catellatospora sp. KI3]|uniref:SDR family NAD(P)-dependent oxidoreductase n=1 Tax=Catellatospora sp. KI3 TaxID=3041620 RepID=UPI0024822368|nr:SDR family NAD(P)-dependent oxidoreductase [Catellatospora sp. KI3]MDI1461491.1 SDR family NAD(P)-dependent oxidoreductase [Catellatospora sp. KI3]